jgi:diguanylate cyclase (GGDEF)-like protein
MVRELVDVHLRAGASAGRADRWSAVVLGLGYLTFAVGSALPVRGLGWDTVALAVPLVLLYVVAYRTEFVATSGSAVPTEPVLVAMLLLLPLRLVPLVVLLALQLAGLTELRRGTRFGTVLVQWTTGWHCLGPVAVLWVASAPTPSLRHAPVYLAALVAQFGVDAAVAAIRTWALGVPVKRLVHPLSWTLATDSLLAPIGLAVVIAGGRSPATMALLAAPIGLVRLLARDRTQHLQTAVTISSAFTAVHEEARVDAPTGLANRRGWLEAIADAGRRLSDGSAVAVTVLAADLDGLKDVNDSYGHAAGDALIAGMARALQVAVPQAAVIARLGGDEFGVLIVDQVTPQAHDKLKAAVRAAMAGYRGVDGTTLSASLGAACAPPEPSVEEASRAADLRAAEDKIARKAGRH